MMLPPMTLRLYARERDGLFEEVSPSGYAPISLEPARWTHGVAQSDYPEQTIHFSRAVGWVRGWYMCREDGACVKSGAFQPIEIKSPGDTLTLTVRIDLPELMTA